MKAKRHDAIISIIKKEEIITQEMLRDRLAEQGFNVTQATVSRDISYLGLIKLSSEDGISYYAIPKTGDKPQFDDIFKTAVIGYENIQNIVVIKCRTGLANAACASLDDMNISDIAGTVAGDDTFIAIFRSEKNADDFIRELKKQLD
ncbi:MAG: hypothetical protein GX346_07310 [Clostridiales bacterium]|nr:hypothetical protein [Clostridiales bacterium]